MNVALIVPEFPPDTIGGGGPVFEMLAMTLWERGHRVRVLTSRTFNGPRSDDSRYPFTVRRVAQLPHYTPQLKTYMPPSPLGLPGAEKFLAGSHAYHLHGYGVAFIDTIFNLFVPPSRAVFTTHGFPRTVLDSGGPLAAAYQLYEKYFGSRILRDSARATGVSTQAASEAQVASGREVTMIPNGFVPLISGTPHDPSIERELAKGPYLLGVGRLEVLKGFDYTIEALALLRERAPSLRLLLAGADNGRERLLREMARRLNVQDAVSFLGPVPRGQLTRLYDNAACVIISSQRESFSMVTLEAMSRGAACVASAVGGILDIVSDGENALLFPAGDVAAMSACVERILHSPELKKRFEAAGSTTIARFSWSEVASEYEKVYTSL